MSNWFKMGDKKVDRIFLRCSAVYRCCKRYGMGKTDAITALSKFLRHDEANALYELWGFRNERS